LERIDGRANGIAGAVPGITFATKGSARAAKGITAGTKPITGVTEAIAFLTFESLKGSGCLRKRLTRSIFGKTEKRMPLALGSARPWRAVGVVAPQIHSTLNHQWWVKMV